MMVRYHTIVCMGMERGAVGARRRDPCRSKRRCSHPGCRKPRPSRPGILREPGPTPRTHDCAGKDTYRACQRRAIVARAARGSEGPRQGREGREEGYGCPRSGKKTQASELACFRSCTPEIGTTCVAYTTRVMRVVLLSSHRAFRTKQVALSAG